ncbi:MAG: hypothetical protein CML20_12620 [Rheinheimera sp.]|nr:hypothetical protein [Rheinheimera sp.]|tara:strand:+ start:20190 stop:20477 length:288 start_codon:yes stop_codon:yes gene_type:complete
MLQKLTFIFVLLITCSSYAHEKNNTAHASFARGFASTALSYVKDSKANGDGTFATVVVIGTLECAVISRYREIPDSQPQLVVQKMDCEPADVKED